MNDVVPDGGLRGAGTEEYRERRAALLVAETELRDHRAGRAAPRRCRRGR